MDPSIVFRYRNASPDRINNQDLPSTGGNWIFVVSPDGSEAVRRPVKLGRRNTDFIEVLDGLEAGEKVITSPYTGYNGLDRLKLNEA